MIKSIIDKLNSFANDPDRGIGHGITHGLYYGIIILTLTPVLPWWGVAIVCAMNHARVLYQELIVENWIVKKWTGDTWYDSAFRPLQTDLVVLLAYLPHLYWLVLCPLILLIGFKKKNDWPAIIFWK